MDYLKKGLSVIFRVVFSFFLCMFLFLIGVSLMGFGAEFKNSFLRGMFGLTGFMLIFSPIAVFSWHEKEGVKDSIKIWMTTAFLIVLIPILLFLIGWCLYNLYNAILFVFGLSIVSSVIILFFSSFLLGPILGPIFGLFFIGIITWIFIVLFILIITKIRK